MFWIALEVSIPKIGFSIMLSLTVKKVDVCSNLTESRNLTTLTSDNHSNEITVLIDLAEPNLH